ncbi:PP2C family protein-serine/threonine phosphatase [Streptomyces sp. NPDC058045]|uniref:PP2C family protein-serine/threonine phosphatase n=1 Tax=Streptomyces sp. NPDC058045 TaxID=3346311 RepID=UPI0036E8EDB6
MGQPISDENGQPGPVPHTASRLLTEQNFVRALPVLLIAVSALVVAVVPVRYSVVPVLVAPPLVAATFYRLRGTVLIGLASLAIMIVRRLDVGDIAQTRGVSGIATFLVVSLLAVLINREVRRSDALLASSRQVAEAAQRAVLPAPPARLAGLDIAARYEAAQAEAFIGGDFYAVQDTPHGIRIVLGDVRGKGMDAVGAVAVVIGAFREAAEWENTLEAVARRLDRALSRDAVLRYGDEPATGPGRDAALESFATAVLVEIPHGESRLRLLNRGHPDPLLLAVDGRLRELPPAEAALPLGFGDLGGRPDRSTETDFPPGATLLLFTDGLTEARDRHGTFYDPVTFLTGRVFRTPGAMLTTLVEDVRRYTGDGSTDDLALLAVRRPITPWTGPEGIRPR